MPMRSVKKLSPETGLTVISLPVVFTMFIALVGVVWLTQDVGSADIVLKNAVAIATQGASQQFDAQGRINYSKAQAAFTCLLDQDCQLDDRLQAMPHSPFLGRADYTLAVYNGKVCDPPGIIFTYSRGLLSEEPVSQTGFPVKVTLPGGITVNLESPGVVSEVSIRPQNLFPRKEVYSRWAACHLVKLQGTWVVVLQGRSG